MMMNNELPAPLVGPDVDLQDFAFMPLDVVRLRDSGLTAKASGDEFRAAVLLWCASWHQIPAASLPNDESELANLCGYGRALKEWKKIREGALRGWVLCSDGRLYHDAVAEKARDAWQSKMAQRARTEAARRAREEARHRQLQGPSQTPKSSVTETVTETVTSSKGQGQGQGIVNPCEPPAIPEPQLARGVEAIPTPAGAICKALRARGIEAQPADPRVLMLVEQGVALPTIEAAAREAREAKGANARIPVGYVLSILERWAEDRRTRQVAGTQAPPLSGKAGHVAETVAAFTGRTAGEGCGDNGRTVDGIAQRIVG